MTEKEVEFTDSEEWILKKFNRWWRISLVICLFSLALIFIVAKVISPDESTREHVETLTLLFGMSSGILVFISYISDHFTNYLFERNEKE
jgi:uncharacterized membrane protein AbrB (regulator of aidB expression)